MRILVAFKVTPDYEALREADWGRVLAGDPEGTRYVRRVLNVFDESALELALRLRDALAQGGAPANLAALTIGGRESEPFLKTLLALGYERAARADAGADLDFAPAATASLIAAHAAEAGSDLLLLGCSSGPADSGVVPFLAAEALGWPCLTQLTDIAPAGARGVRVACAVDDGELRATVRLPAVLAVGNAVVSCLRVPTLSDRLASRDKATELLVPHGLGAKGISAPGAPARGYRLDLELVDRHRAGAVVGGDAVADKVRALLDGRSGASLVAR